MTSSTGSGTIDAAAPALSTAEVADIAEKWAGSAAELERLGDDPLRRTGLRLLATDDYDVWLLGRTAPGSVRTTTGVRSLRSP